MLRISNDYCFRRAAQGQLPQCNWKNTVLRAVLKSHKGLKGTKVFAFGCSVRNVKKFSKLTAINPCWSPFIVKLQPEIAYKKSQSKGYSGNFIKKDAYTEILHKYFPVGFEKTMNTTLNTSARVSLK